MFMYQAKTQNTGKTHLPLKNLRGPPGLNIMVFIQKLYSTYSMHWGNSNWERTKENIGCCDLCLICFKTPIFHDHLILAQIREEVCQGEPGAWLSNGHVQTKWGNQDVNSRIFSLTKIKCFTVTPSHPLNIHWLC